MDKENSRSAAGLRRSAIAERLRLREEWSALKGTSNENTKNTKNVLTKNTGNIVISFPKNAGATTRSHMKNNDQTNHAVSEALRGTVVLVDVGSETRALPLRAALAALGATVVPTWSPLVTHLVWSQGGCRRLRARARALAARLVSPLWAEACAAAARRLPEKLFPAPARASDLPSPATLTRLLKKAEHENISLHNLLSDSTESDRAKPTRLRISSETEQDTSRDTSADTTHDKSADKSRDKSDKSLSPDPETRVNTAPRRALPASVTPQRPTKSKRKLFTQREADVNTDDESDKETPDVSKTIKPKLTQRGKIELVRAERIARRLLGAPAHAQTDKLTPRQQRDNTPRIVLTGMSNTERREIWQAVKQLNGKVQNNVNKRTTHILMGSCTDTAAQQTQNNKQTQIQQNQIVMCQKCHTPEEILAQMFLKNVSVRGTMNGNDENVLCTCYNNISGVRTIADVDTSGCVINVNTKPRTVNALLGAVRGCRVLYAQWARDCLRAKRWLHHFGYEVPHLVKVSQKARIERSALCKMRCEYAYDVFNGMRVRVSERAEQRNAVNELLTLCGAITQDGGAKQDGGKKQNGGTITADFDITIGRENGEVSSKWVFDSIAAARMKTTRRYVNKDFTGDNI